MSDTPRSTSPPEDGERLKSDDALMLQIAHDYMKLMGIENTQYIIAWHIDREHPHCHIVFNWVDNDGKRLAIRPTSAEMKRLVRC